MGFFSNTVGSLGYQRYGLSHFLTFFISIVIVILMYIFRNKLTKHDKLVRYIMAIILFLNMTIYYVLEIIQGTWTYKEHLPLHLCFIANYLMMYILISNNKNLFKIIYFLTFIGPIPYIIFPDMLVAGVRILVGPDRFMFWQAYISHYFLMMCSLYCLFCLKWKVSKNDLLKSIVYSNIIFIVVWIFNIIFKTNYIMTDTLPQFVIDMFPFVKIIDFPIVWLEIAGFLGLLVAYIPVLLINRQNLNKINM